MQPKAPLPKLPLPLFLGRPQYRHLRALAGKASPDELDALRGLMASAAEHSDELEDANAILSGLMLTTEDERAALLVGSEAAHLTLIASDYAEREVARARKGDRLDALTESDREDFGLEVDEPVQVLTDAELAAVPDPDAASGANRYQIRSGPWAGRWVTLDGADEPLALRK